MYSEKVKASLSTGFKEEGKPRLSDSVVIISVAVPHKEINRLRVSSLKL